MTAPAGPSPKVAIIGAGAIGRGWAALCASAGWECTLIDTDAQAGDRAVAEIARRARALGVGLLSGGYGQEELERAGAFRVYQDPLDLLTHLDELGIRRAD